MIMMQNLIRIEENKKPKHVTARAYPREPGEEPQPQTQRRTRRRPLH